MKRSLALLATLAAAATGGCVERTLTINSNPPGALLYLNDQEIGRTPVTHDFLWYGRYDVTLRRDGYETLKTTQDVKPPLFQIIPFDLFADVLPVQYKDEQHFSFNMTPTIQVDPQTLVERAREMKTKLKASERATTLPSQP